MVSVLKRASESKTVALKIEISQSLDARIKSVQEQLKKIDSDLEFDPLDSIQMSIEKLVVKAEKELAVLKKQKAEQGQ